MVLDDIKDLNVIGVSLSLSLGVAMTVIVQTSEYLLSINILSL